MILMAGVYSGAVFGGSISSILINAPGCSSTVVTAFDGYPMAPKGQAGKALALAAYAPFTGGTLSAIMLLIAAFAGKGQVVKAWMMTICSGRVSYPCAINRP